MLHVRLAIAGAACCLVACANVWGFGDLDLAGGDSDAATPDGSDGPDADAASSDVTARADIGADSSSGDAMDSGVDAAPMDASVDAAAPADSSADTAPTCNASTCQGCCLGDVCQVAGDTTCGLGGVACFDCTQNGADRVCSSGSCAPCNATSCPTGCCDSTTLCQLDASSYTVCGYGGRTCQACSPGEICQAGECLLP